MRITADTNILVRALVADDPRQAKRAQETLAAASLVAISVTALCEVVWVLSRGYGVPAADVAAAMRQLIASATVVTNRPAVEAGLALFIQGGDFADGVIAHEGEALGGETFVTFDKDAARRLAALGRACTLLR